VRTTRTAQPKKNDQPLAKLGEIGMTTLQLNEIKVQYEEERPVTGRRSPVSPLFQPELEARLLMQLAHLATTAPAVAAEVETIIRAWPSEARRIIKAGQIVAMGGIEELAPSYYRVKSQKSQATYMTFFIDDTDQAYCSCLDWQAGNMFHNFGIDREPRAPFHPGLGVVCKHAIACIIWEATQADPHINMDYYNEKVQED
jgi:hypothetical protein